MNVNMKSQSVILGARRMDFKNGDDIIKGTQVWYHAPESENSENVIGFIPQKAWLPLEDYPQFKDDKIRFPHFCEAIVNVDVAKNKMKVVGFDLFPEKPSK